MRTVFSFLAAGLIFMAPAHSQTDFEWSSFLANGTVSTQHHAIEVKIAEQAGFFMDGISYYVRKGLESRMVSYGSIGMVTIIGLCMLLTVGEPEKRENTVLSRTPRRCFNRRNRLAKIHWPSERKRWTRRVKVGFRRQVLVN